MRLTSYSDYSLRLLMFAAVNEGKRFTIQDAAESFGISKAHLMKVAFQLGQRGFLETVRGRGGGIRLARPAGKIGLGEVLRITEENFTVVECFDATNDQCAITRTCRLKGIVHKALQAFFQVLDQYTLADLADHHPALARMLAPV